MAVAGLVSAALLAQGAPASSDQRAVEAGSAIATGQVLGVQLTYGGLSLPISLATSSASYQEDAAQATSQGISTGTLGGVATGSAGAPGCPGTGASAPAATQQPPFAPVTAVSAGSGQLKRSGDLPIGSGQAEARPDPLRASSSTDLVGITIPGVIKVSGTSTATVAHDPGKQRDARADVAVSVVLGGGVVRLSALSWEVRHRSGRAAGATGEFALAGLTVGGRTYPVGTTAQLRAGVEAANAALKLLGVSVVLPEGATDGSSTLSPLAIRVSGTPLLASVIRPLLQLKGSAQELVGSVLKAGGCALASLAGLVGGAQLVVDVLLAVLSGEGALELQVGGAQAATAPPPAYQDPFGDGGGSTDGAGDGAGDGDGVEVPAPAAPVAVGAPQLSLDPGAPAGAPVLTPRVTTSAGRIGCASLNPLDHSPCSDGARPRVAGLLLLGALALVAADLYQGRRRRPIVRRNLT